MQRCDNELDLKIMIKFDMIEIIGSGAFGVVWKAKDRNTKTNLAIKKIFNAFLFSTDAQATYREIMYLHTFRKHKNIISLLGLDRAGNNKDIYLIFEYMESDLLKLLANCILNDYQKSFIMYQLLSAINFMHSGNIVHRDLKPANILIDRQCRCKVADFGMARSLCQVNKEKKKSAKATLNPNFSLDIGTRWYRSPELLFQCKRHTKAIDIWALGCILGEMTIGHPIFAGYDDDDQIEKILSGLPKATREDFIAVGAESKLKWLSQLKLTTINSLEEMISVGTEEAKHLIISMLVLDPSKRITAKEGLLHNYVKKHRQRDTELEFQVDIMIPLTDCKFFKICEYRSVIDKLINKIESNESEPNEDLSSIVPLVKLGHFEEKTLLPRLNNFTYRVNNPRSFPWNKKYFSKQSNSLIEMRSLPHIVKNFDLNLEESQKDEGKDQYVQKGKSEVKSIKISPFLTFSFKKSDILSVFPEIKRE